MVTQRRSTTTDEVADVVLTTLCSHPHVDVAGLGKRWAGLSTTGLAALTEYEGSVLWLHRRLGDLKLLDSVPPPFVEWLSARARRLAARNLLVDAQRDELVAMLNDLSVPHVLLKGAAWRLVADRYPYADARVTTDVDVLVPEQLARPTWERLRGAGFATPSGQTAQYAAHFHLPPLANGRAVKVELHTSTSDYLAAPLAWRRFDRSAQVASCGGGATRVPAATELFWHAITHAPLPEPYAFRLRFFQDAAVGWTAGTEIDWNEIATRLGSAELPDGALARRWVGGAARLSGAAAAVGGIGPAPALDLTRALSWRLTVFRLLGPRRTAGPVWGPQAMRRGRRLLIDAGVRAELGLPASAPGHGTPLDRLGRHLAVRLARACHRTWRVLNRR